MEQVSEAFEIGKFIWYVVYHFITSWCIYETLKQTETGYVSIQPDVLEVEFGRLGLRGVALSGVVHGKHSFLSELSVVVKVDFGIKANDCGQRAWMGIGIQLVICQTCSMCYLDYVGKIAQNIFQVWIFLSNWVLSWRKTKPKNLGHVTDKAKRIVGNDSFIWYFTLSKRELHV